MPKLLRKNQEIFAENAADVGVFGSAQLGTKTTSKDLDVLQGLAAFQEGWKDAALGGKRRPTIEEFNGLNYINTTQISQIFETGIPEYLAEEVYYIGSIAKEVGTAKLYASITDDNTNNPLTDIVNWKFLGDLSGLGSVASNVIVVNSLADLPAPSAGEILLGSGKKYLFNNVIVSADALRIPTGGFTTLSCVDLSGPFVYVGAGAGIRGLNFALFVTDFFHTQAPAGHCFELDGAGSHFQVNTIASQSGVSQFKCSTATLFFTNYTGGSVSFDERSDLGARVQSSFSHSTITGSDSGVNVLEFKGTGLANIGLQASGITTGGVTDNCLNFDPSLEIFGTSIAFFGGFVNNQAGGQIFAPNSLKQDYGNADFTAVAGGVSNSTTSIQIGFEGNSESTIINTIGVSEPINTRWQHQLPERLVFQDYITFDNASNTITTRLPDGTTPYNHGLVDGDRFKFKAGITPAGTLPPEFNESTEYYIISAAATTFQVSLTLGGSALTFLTDGTGENYFRHLSGVNASSWLVYVGLEAIKLAFNGATSFVTESGATDREVFMSMTKFDASFVTTTELSLFGRGELTVVNNSLVGNSPIHGLVSLSFGESIKILATNNDSTTNLVATNSNISILKV